MSAAAPATDWKRFVNNSEAITKSKPVEVAQATIEGLAAVDAALAEVKKAASQPAYPTYATPIDREAEKRRGWETPREFISKVLEAAKGGKVDKRLIFTNQQGIVTKTVGSDEGREISDPYGGFLVPPAFSPQLLKVDPEEDPMSRYVTSIPMERPIVNIPARTDKNHTTSVSGGLTVTRRPETVAGTATQMQFEQVRLEAISLFGLSYATEELLQDSPISFAAILAAGFSDQFTYHLVKERLSGTGVGEFLGVLNATDSGGTGPTVSVSKETGQAANTIVYQNIVKMRAQCWGYNKAIWIANHDTFPQLSTLKLDIGTGGSAMYQPSLREDRPDMLLGRPIVYSEYAQTLGTTGDIILGNWAEYLEGTYQPLQNEESIHVRFVNHERTFKFWMRNAGAPWWRSALTPVYSSNKLSPFVILATRS